jgi:2'-5' RNA ligase
MMFGYHSNDLASDSSNCYAVVILLPDYLDRIIAPLRERYDPDHTTIGAHISLVFPFETERPLDDVSQIIHRITDQITPFRVELNSIGDFYPDYPVIYWAVNRQSVIDDLYKSLYTGLDLALPHKQFCPHVTVAREISAHRVVMVKENIVPYLPEEGFAVNAIDLISPAANRHWVSVRTFSLHHP